MRYLMKWNDHSKLKDTHAFLSPSNYHWIYYTDEKLETAYNNSEAKVLGVRLHQFACEAITLGINLKKCRKTLNLHVNDAIGYRMKAEQVLYFSENCYGCADAIGFDGKILRIHDLKTGDVPGHYEQIYIYAALFCLEYHIDPNTIQFKLRIYQFNDYTEYEPTADEIKAIMDVIKHSDSLIFNIKREGE